MERKVFPPPPRVAKVLATVGEQMKLARLRRQLSTQQVADRAGISRPTLLAIEKGAAKVSMGSYAMVLFVLNQEQDLLKLAGNDVLGQKLMDIGLVVKERAPKRKSS